MKHLEGEISWNETPLNMKPDDEQLKGHYFPGTWLIVPKKTRSRTDEQTGPDQRQPEQRFFEDEIPAPSKEPAFFAGKKKDDERIERGELAVKNRKERLNTDPHNWNKSGRERRGGKDIIAKDDLRFSAISADDEELSRSQSFAIDPSFYPQEKRMSDSALSPKAVKELVHEDELFALENEYGRLCRRFEACEEAFIKMLLRVSGLRDIPPEGWGEFSAFFGRVKKEVYACIQKYKPWGSDVPPEILNYDEKRLIESSSPLPSMQFLTSKILELVRVLQLLQAYLFEEAIMCDVRDDVKKVTQPDEEGGAKKFVRHPDRPKEPSSTQS